MSSEGRKKYSKALQVSQWVCESCEVPSCSRNFLRKLDQELYKLLKRSLEFDTRVFQTLILKYQDNFAHPLCLIRSFVYRLSLDGNQEIPSNQRKLVVSIQNKDVADSSYSSWVCELCKEKCENIKVKELEWTSFIFRLKALSLDFRVFFSIFQVGFPLQDDSLCSIMNFFRQAARSGLISTEKQRGTMKNMLTKLIKEKKSQTFLKKDPKRLGV